MINIERESTLKGKMYFSINSKALIYLVTVFEIIENLGQFMIVKIIKIEILQCGIIVD